MEIKGNKSENIFSKLIQMISPRRRTILFLLAGVLLISIAFIAGALVYRTRYLTLPASQPKLSTYVRVFLKNPLTIPLNYIRGRFASPERIYIDIDYKNFQRLSYWRSLALENRTLYAIEQGYLNAQIRYKEDTIPVQIRLKGGMAAQHLAGKKWSFRVRIRGDKALWGMKNFALMDPQRRTFMLTWFCRRVMREEGLVSKRYKFVEVVINGENKGIYAMDEHYDKAMVEANQRREGPIIRVVQEPGWLERDVWCENYRKDDYYYFSADFDAIDTKKIMSDPVKLEQFQKAVNLYEAFRKGDLPTHKVFDMDKFAKWLAVGDIMGAWHGIGASAVKFYYNPITSKLEPVPDDEFNETSTDPGNRIFRLNDQYNKSAFLKQFFSDPKFTEKYIQELERVSRSSYLDNILNALSEEIAENLDIMHRDYPIYEFPREQLYKNQEVIREILKPYKGITAYFEEKGPGSIILSIASVKIIPVEILNVECKGGTVLKPKQGRTILRGKDYATPPVYDRVEFSFPDGFEGIESLSELKVNYKLLGTSRLRTEPVFPRPSYNPSFFADDFIRQEPNFQDFPFIEFDLSSKEIYLKQGDWILDRALIIPKGYVFIINAGTSLNLTNTARILSYSPLRFIGSDDRPIIICSSDKSGQGIAVLNAAEESFLENVVFENLSAPMQSGWQLTGAITFYDTIVYIDKCRFFANTSEDTLNIVQSRFTINNSFFKDSASDALDFDFAEGLILNTSFVQSTNDAVDFSGSVVTISQSFINGAGDKGLSVGENSQVTAKEVEIMNANIGIASKDFSELNGKDIKISNSNIGLAAFIKKPEFGPACIKVEEINFIDVPTKHLIEEGSTLFLNDRKICGSEKNLGQRFYQ